MKLIIAGTRTISLNEEQMETMLSVHSIYPDEIVCGLARGIDVSGKLFARLNEIDVVEFPADWETHGKAAGPIRNREMAEYADALLLIWDGKSRGSYNMKWEMESRNKPIYEVIIKSCK